MSEKEGNGSSDLLESTILDPIYHMLYRWEDSAMWDGIRYGSFGRKKVSFLVGPQQTSLNNHLFEEHFFRWANYEKLTLILVFGYFRAS